MAHLQYRDGEWYLHASMKKVEDDETPDSEAKHRTVLGVNLGVNNIAVATTGRFWSADEFNHWRREYETRRGTLQQCGSRHSHDNIQSVNRKETGRFEIVLHTVSNELIEEAVEHDVQVVQVDPRNTSKQCSTCGFTHDDNRSGEAFVCQKCGCENHADYNAAKNIGLQYLRRRQNANDGGAPVDVRLNRGMLNVNGEYSPTVVNS
nr:zinc ribbon domain-containing protein [Haladaptatus sp. W1]